MIHSWTVFYGHCISLRTLYTTVTGNTLEQLKQEKQKEEDDYIFIESDELQEWYRNWSSSNELKSCGFSIDQFSYQQCQDAGIPVQSVALGYKVKSLDHFSPVFLTNLFSDSNLYEKHQECVQKINNIGILELILYTEPQLLLVVDECDCCP